jgi:hypothetical protein
LYPRLALDGSTATIGHGSGFSRGSHEPPGRLLQSAPQDKDLAPAVPVGNIEAASHSGQTQPDLHGDYVGPASGVSFLLRAQKRLQQSRFSYDASSIFTFGDTPLRYSEPTYCVVMSKEETAILVQRYFDFTVPVDRFLHRPTVEGWLRDFYETMGVIGTKSDAPTRRALLFMVFALAEEHMSPKPSAVTADLRFVNFAFNLQAYFLTAQQRWLFFGSGSLTFQGKGSCSPHQCPSTVVSMPLASRPVSDQPLLELTWHDSPPRGCHCPSS